MAEPGVEIAGACNEWADLYGDLFQQPSEDTSGSDAEADQPEPTKGFGTVLLEDEIKELRSKLATAEQLAKEVGSQLEEQQAKASALDKERATLVKNISSLYRTAVLEIGWKVDEIKNLRSELQHMHQLQKQPSSRGNPAYASAPVATQKQRFYPKAGTSPPDVGHKRQRLSRDDVGNNTQDRSLQPLSDQPHSNASASQSQGRGTSAAVRAMHESIANGKGWRSGEDKSKGEENMPRGDARSSQDGVNGRKRDDGHRHEYDSQYRQKGADADSQDRRGHSKRERDSDSVLGNISSEQKALERDSYRGKHTSAGQRAEVDHRETKKENRAPRR
eukprot:gene8248-1517_t